MVSALLLCAGGHARADQPPQPTETTVAPAELLTRAITAQGGKRALKKLGSMTVKSQGTYQGMPYKATFYWQAPALYSLFIDAGKFQLVMGASDSECWSKPHEVVLDCSTAEAKGWVQMAAAIRAQHLHSLDPAKLKPAHQVKVGEVVANTFRSGEITLAFHPESNLLLQVRFPGWSGVPGEFVNTFSEHKAFKGVQIGTRVVSTFAGKPHAEEQILTVRAGKVPKKKLARPAQVKSGLVITRPSMPRAVATLVHEGGADEIRGAVDRALAYAGQHGHSYGPAGGVLITPLHREPEPVAKGKWRVDVSLDAHGLIEARKDSPVAIENLAARPSWGYFHVGDYASAWAALEAKEREMRTAGIGPREGARWTQVTFHDPNVTPAARRVSLLRIDVLVIEDAAPPSSPETQKEK